MQIEFWKQRETLITPMVDYETINHVQVVMIADFG